MIRFTLTSSIVLAGLAVSPVVPGDAFAGSGAIVSLPAPGVKAKSGLLVQVDTRWLDGTGYRPVRVRLSSLPAGPAAADRRLSVTLRPRGWRTGTRLATVTATVELPQGSRVAQQTVAVPHHEGWSTIDVQVREDGALLPDLSARYLRIPIRNHYEWAEAAPSILFIDSDTPPWPPNASQRSLATLVAGQSTANRLPDVRSIASRLPTSSWNGVDESALDTSKAIEDRETLRLLRDLPQMEMLSLAELPDRWIELTCVDIAFVSRSDIQLLRSDFPQKWEALRAWVETGTVLCVTGVGVDDQQLAELESLVGAAPLPAADQQWRGWSIPEKKTYSDRILAFAESAPYRAVADTAILRGAARGAADVLKPPKLEPSDPRPFAWRELGAGYLVAIGDEPPFLVEPEEWCWLLNSLSQRNWMWYRRHGMSMHRENPDYWKLLIPNVGEAPVNSFLLLISLFVILIGPVNYCLLQRSGRLYLLLVTVPAGAISITVGLLGYALLTDGFSVRVRTRSVTEIDQRSGQAVAWSRQTYYAGMAPAGGIAFPLDAAVYPVEFRPQNPYLPTDRRWHTVWESKQRLAAGFLPSRRTTQFLIVESRRTTAGLDIQASGDGDLQVTNRLGTDLLRLLVRDAAGQYHAGERLSAGDSTVLGRVKPAEVAGPWNAWLAGHMPRYPQGFNPYQMGNAAQIFPAMNYSWSGVDDSLPAPTFDSSIFETRLQTALRQDFRRLKPSGYLAIVKSSPEVSLAAPGADEQASLHVVLGRW